MPLDAPLNQRQIDVLRWVSDGCPEGHWKDFTHKTTASALDWRGLITVSKLGGIWTASITPAGAQYLKTGNYPPGHRLHRVRPPRPPTVSPVPATSQGGRFSGLDVTEALPTEVDAIRSQERRDCSLRQMMFGHELVSRDARLVLGDDLQGKSQTRRRMICSIRGSREGASDR